MKSCLIKHKEGNEPKYNPSLIEWHGKLISACRVRHNRCYIQLCSLSDEYEPCETINVTMPVHSKHIAAQEDPRLFCHKEKLWVAYSAREPLGRLNFKFNQMLFCPLNNEVRFLEYKNRNEWEKNWQIFEYNHELYAIYSIKPWTVVKIEPNNEVYNIFSSEIRIDHWSGPWHLRGGACPVRHGDEFYSFGHWVQRNVYGMFCVTFQATPPFLPTRITPSLLTGQDEDMGFWGRKVIFPGGAVFKNGNWLIAYGRADKYCEIAEFTEAEIEDKLGKLC